MSQVEKLWQMQIKILLHYEILVKQLKKIKKYDADKQKLR